MVCSSKGGVGMPLSILGNHLYGRLVDRRSQNQCKIKRIEGSQVTTMTYL